MREDGFDAVQTKKEVSLSGESYVFEFDRSDGLVVLAIFFWSILTALRAHQLESGTDIDEPTCRCRFDAPKFVLRQITECWPEVEFASLDQLVKWMANRE